MDPALTATGRADTEAINTAHATASVTNKEGDMTLIDDDNTFRCLKIRPAYTLFSIPSLINSNESWIVSSKARVIKSS